MPNNQTKGSHVSQPERFCKYIHRYCNQTRLDGYDYCIRHILEDKTAPFRQCMYVNPPNKKRCTNAAPKTDKNDRRDNTLCPFHIKKALMKNKAYHPKKKSVVEGPATLLRSLEHYCADAIHDPSYNRDAGPNEKYWVSSCEGGRPSNLEHVDASLEDDEPIVAKAHVENLEDDCCWIEKTDTLQHAGVYTQKEVVSITREKLLRLQHLYCEELKVLYRELKESRRKFVASVNPTLSTSAESEGQKLVYRDLREVKGRLLAKIEKPSTSAASEVKPQYSSKINTRLTSILSQYHQRSGIERIFRRQVLVRRAGLPKTVKPSCTFEKNGLKCPFPALVSTKFCVDHILSDPNQVMFVPCELKNCTKPVLPIEENVACDYHTSFALSRQKAAEAAQQPSTADLLLEPEHFQSMDDIASLGLDAISPGSLFGLDQFGEPGESTDTVLSEDQTDLMQIQAITLNPPTNILSDSRKSESE